MTEGDPAGIPGSVDREVQEGIDRDRAQTNARFELLAEVIGAFAEATTDYDALLQTISRKLAETTGDLCSVLLVADDLSTLSLVATYDSDPIVLATARATFSTEPFAVVPTQQRVLETGEAFMSPQITADRTRQITTDKRATFTETIGMHSVLLVALRARGQPLGLLNLVRHRKDFPAHDERDRELAQLLADHAAVAIANARVLRQQHDELRRARDAAEAASHDLRLANDDARTALRELESFSYTVAHDLRAPLRAINAFSEILDVEFADRLDDQGRSYLRRVRRASTRMTQLIEDLLGLARLSQTPMRRERIDVSDVARQILLELGARDGGRRVVHSRVADNLVAHADPALARIVLENLLGNAWKFTANRADAVIEVDCEVRGSDVLLTVRDNGAGFDPAFADRLFVPFQRLHADVEFEGTGVGLATVHRIIARHHGRVWAASQPGSGATFFFTFE